MKKNKEITVTYKIIGDGGIEGVVKNFLEARLDFAFNTIVQDLAKDANMEPEVYWNKCMTALEKDRQEKLGQLAKEANMTKEEFWIKYKQDAVNERIEKLKKYERVY